MSYSHCTLSEFLISKDNGRSIIALFTSRPTPLEEKNLGRLFALMEVEIVDETYEEVLDVLANEVNAQYYQSESFELETAFEYALQKLNNTIQEIVGEVGTEWLDNANMIIGVQRDSEVIFTNIGRVISLLIHGDKIIDVLDTAASKAQTINPVKVFTNIVSGEVTKSGTLFFSTETILDYLSKEKIKRVLKDQRIHDAIAEFHELLEEDTIDTNFCGLIARHETVATKADAKEEIAEADIELEDLDKDATSHAGRMDSMATLVDRQNETEELLSSSMWPGLKKGMKGIFGSLSERREATDDEEVVDDTVYTVVSDEAEETETPAVVENMAEMAKRANEERKVQEGDESEVVDKNTDDSRTPTIGDILDDIEDPILDTPSNADEKTEETTASEGNGKKAAAVAGQAAGKAAKGAGNIFVKLLALIGAGCMAILKWIGEVFISIWEAFGGKRRGASNDDIKYRSTRNGRRSTAQALGNSIATVFLALINWFARLSLPRKALLIVAIVVLVLFARSIVNTGEQQISEENENQYAQVLSQVDVKVNEGRAAVIFNTDTARTLFIEARDLLTQVPTDSQAYEDRGAELARIISNQLEEVNNVVTIENPSVVLDYSTISSDVQLSNVILLGASIYGFDRNNQSVYRGNLESQETSVSIAAGDDSARYKEVVKASPGTGIALLDDDTAATFQPIAESLAALNLIWPEGSHSFADASLFGTRLYLLDTASNQIYRHTQEGDVFGEGTAWLSGSHDLSNAVAMSIDGNIWVMKSNGQVLKFFGGTKEDFELSTIEPALTSATELYTDEASEHLYILDAQQARIVKYTKDGKFVAQFTSPQFTQMIDFIIDEANNKAYILNGEQIMEISLESTTPAEATEEPATEGEAENTEARAGLQA